jgi:hypothetical protein
MNIRHEKTVGHSAIVRMELRLNGRVFPIAQLGPNFLVLKDAVDHPAAEAEIGMWIDGREDLWRVLLAEGIKASQPKTAISACPEINGSTVG